MKTFSVVLGFLLALSAGAETPSSKKPVKPDYSRESLMFVFAERETSPLMERVGEALIIERSIGAFDVTIPLGPVMSMPGAGPRGGTLFPKVGAFDEMRMAFTWMEPRPRERSDDEWTRIIRRIEKARAAAVEE